MNDWVPNTEIPYSWTPGRALVYETGDRPKANVGRVLPAESTHPQHA